ncbi:alpha-amylase family glycosyl hydrolase [Bifidobacterium moukalabense]|uniref:alpha-amylase family glycosyl hydrolase n=1 Tax=Bifidobacterium moukalabense TaxID=1333651 RepID=UPI0010F83791|nr:alpha-amylase family glycosyl hydrolase [Bifidobacterium moukalabense]
MANWLNNAIFYEIYPQSFKDSNADGIGDFQGIISALEYIRDLGCNAIWINPCFDSSFYDAGYDVRDYYTVAARYGSNEDLAALFERAHELGMHVLLDLVPGHTAIDNPWFKESCKDERNAWTDRYIWRPMSQSPDLNSPYASIRGFLGGIAERPDAAAVNCFSTQACLNYGFGTVTEDWQFAADSPEAQAGRLLIQDIMDFWLGLGCDGFRVDMAASLVKEDPDHHWTSKLWRQVREHLDERYPQAVLVSEWGNPHEALHAGFDMDFLLHFGPSHYLDLFRENPYFSASANGDIRAFADTYRKMLADTAGGGYICIPSGNHDMSRMRDTLTPDEMKLAFTFLLTMPGCPFIYYGDEIGMRYAHGLRSKEGGYERTGSRTPMQWDCSTNAGFSAARRENLYLPVDGAADAPNVASQEEDADSLLHAVRALNTLRMAHPALQADGDIEFLHAQDHAYPLVYARTTGRAGGADSRERIVVAINPSSSEARCALPAAYGGAIGATEDDVLFHIGAIAGVREGELRVPAGSATVFGCR